MWRHAWLTLVLCGVSFAQIQNFTVAGASDAAAFDTPLRLRSGESGRAAKFRVYRVDRSGEHQLIQERKGEEWAGAPPGLSLLGAMRAEWSSDGGTMVFTEVWACGRLKGCGFEELLWGRMVRNGAESRVGPGWARVSANGEWVLMHGGMNTGREVEIRKLPTGETWRIPWAHAELAPVGRRAISDDGTAVLRLADGRLWVVKAGEAGRAVGTAKPVRWAAITRNGRQVYYETEAESPSIHKFDLGLEVDEALVEAVEGCHRPFVSDDGLNLVFISGANWEGRNSELIPQVWRMDLISGRLQQVSDSEEPVKDVAVSADGETVWALDRAERIWRADWRDARGEIVAVGQGVLDLPWRPRELAPGGRYRFPGWGLEEGELRLGGRVVETEWRSGEGLELVMPWDVSLGTMEVMFDRTESRFEPEGLWTRVSAVAPGFWRQSEDGRLTRVWRKEGDGWLPVEEGAPARANDVLEVEMTGLGQLDSEGRSNPPVHWILQPGDGQVAVQTAQRGTDGLYRVWIRLPESLEGDRLTMIARVILSEGAVGALGWIPIR